MVLILYKSTDADPIPLRLKSGVKTVPLPVFHHAHIRVTIYLRFLNLAVVILDVWISWSDPLPDLLEKINVHHQLVLHSMKTFRRVLESRENFLLHLMPNFLGFGQLLF